MRRITDQLNREVILKDNPQRIVSLVPSQTELLVDLGLEDSIFGITKFCVHPEYLRKKKKIVGGTKTVHFDKIKTLRPDLILCNKEENTAEMVLELEKIAPVHVSDIETIPDSLEMIGQYGEIFGAPQRAFDLQKEIEEKWSVFRLFAEEQPEKKVAYFIWKKPWMVAGKNTFIDHLLQINNFENLFGDELRYPEVDIERLQTSSPDLVLLSTEPFPFKNKHKKIFQERLPDCRVEVVDGEYFSWYGSRLVKAFDYFMRFHLSLHAS